VSNPFKKVDEFFAAFIDDETNRFFVMNLPFWSFVVYVTWNLTESLGLYLLWVGVVFGLTPYAIARVGLMIYSDDQIKQDGVGRFQPPWAWICGYVVSILVLIGIPGLYFGYVMKFAQSKIFNDLYWGFIVLWWKVFNFYHDYKMKDLEEFAQGFSYRYLTWAWSFMVSAVVIVPGMFYWLYTSAKENFQAEELEESRLVEKDRALKLQEEAQAKEAQKRQLVFEEKKRQEEQAQKEKQRKLQAKINEIKGKDPWDSGFL
jgi:hypothetical protein